MTQTAGKPQTFGTVPVGKPNEGESSYLDMTQTEIDDNILGVSDSDALPEGSVNKYESVESINKNKSQLVSATGIGTVDLTLAGTTIIDMTVDVVNLKVTNGTYDGQSRLIRAKSSVGGKTMSFDSANFKATFDQGIPVLLGTLGKSDYIGVTWNIDLSKWIFMAFNRGA